MGTTNKEVKVPLKFRLKAWWEGYDVADMEAKMLARLAREATASAPPKDSPVVIKAEWDEARIAIAQMVWGDGFCGPGGPENVIAMSKLLALSPKLSAMVIGAGLGGPSRVLAKEFGVWISGYESSKELAEGGMKMSRDAGLEKKAPIKHCDLDNVYDFERQFDRAYSKEAMFTVENKARLLEAIYGNLKDDALFLMTDYVIKDVDSLADPDVVDWLRQEPLDPFPVTSGTTTRTLEAVGFNIRVNKDITEQYLAMITDAWANADQIVATLSQQGDSAKTNLRAILNEAEFWSRRTKIMKSGQLRVCRYLAHKPSAVK